jgi:ketosteroid isomerase-like protein
MAGEPQKPGLDELARRSLNALNRRGFDAGFADFAPDAVWDKGVTFSVSVLRGRPHGASTFVERRVGVVWSWTDGRITRATNYNDIDEARSAAEQLAEDRDYAV